MNEAIDKKIDELFEKRADLVRDIDLEIIRLRGKRKLKCTKCNKKTQINKCTLKQTYYVEDAGYVIGDRIATGNLEWYCPKCNGRNFSYQSLFEVKPEEKGLWDLEDRRKKEFQSFLSRNSKYFKEFIDDKGSKEWDRY